MTLLFGGMLLADDHQLYLRDGAPPALPDDYAKETIARRVTAGPEAIVIHTERNMTVPLRVELHRSRLFLDLERLDHVVERGFAAPSGALVIAGLTDDASTAARAAVPAGPLRALVTFAGLDSLNDDGLEGHVGAHPGLVHEDEAVRVDPVLTRPPAPSEAGDLGPVPLDGDQGLLLTVSPERRTKRQTVSGHGTPGWIRSLRGAMSGQRSGARLEAAKSVMAGPPAPSSEHQARATRSCRP